MGRAIEHRVTNRGRFSSAVIVIFEHQIEVFAISIMVFLCDFDPFIEVSPWKCWWAINIGIWAFCRSLYITRTQ